MLGSNHVLQLPLFLSLCCSTVALTIADNSALFANVSVLHQGPLNDTNADPVCDGSRYGYNVDWRSCSEALMRILRADLLHPLVMGRRGEITYDLNLPYRYLSCKSCITKKVFAKHHFDLSVTIPLLRKALTRANERPADGTCAIDILLNEGVEYDIATTLDILRAAGDVLDACVNVGNNQGGSVGGIGTSLTSFGHAENVVYYFGSGVSACLLD